MTRSRILTTDELVQQIVDALRDSADYEIVSYVANLVLEPLITYTGDGMFEQEVD